MRATIAKITKTESFDVIRLSATKSTSLGSVKMTFFLKLEEHELEEGQEFDLDMNEFEVVSSEYVDKDGLAHSAKWLEPKE